MIRILQGQERQQNQELCDQLYRLRHNIFIGQRSWSLPARLDGRDVDQYDDCPEAVYFCETSDDGQIEAHVRLTPTLTHSLMADYFPHIVDQRYSPRGEGIWEATRYIVLPARKSRAGNRSAKTRILSAMLDWALENKISFIQTVIDTATFPSFVEMTEETIPLGLSYDYGGGPAAPGGGRCMGIRWPVTAKVHNDLLLYGQILSVAEAANRIDAYHSLSDTSEAA